ncbi:MAG: nucleoside kinase [Alphaproteobacteria bacterium]|nr:nucleoside kinase [Alphaproteobacteria bacterium SS10]
MGIKNYLVEGVSGTGKTSVCHELTRRGYQGINGDRELAYQGDPVTGEPLPGSAHEHHIWDVAKVRSIVEDHSHSKTFFCGGSRNFSQFIDLFDEVFVLGVAWSVLEQRLAARGDDEWGGTVEERALVKRVQATGEDTPQIGIRIDTSVPLAKVVDTILNHCE